MTISEIAAHNKRVGGHFFDADTLKFFGQKLSEFKSATLSDGRIVVYCKTHRGWDLDVGESGISTVGIYNKDTGRIDGIIGDEESKVRSELIGVKQ
jgi:hypothetical protein